MKTDLAQRKNAYHVALTVHSSKVNVELLDDTRVQGVEVHDLRIRC